MERSDVVYRAAGDLRARVRSGGERVLRAEPLLNAICERFDFEIQQAAESDVMLGGAYARLQPWCPDDPEMGGNIWIRSGLTTEERNFALAHELGHLILHRGEEIALHGPCSGTDIDERADVAHLRTEQHRVEVYSPRARREQEANAFAAELLAPRGEVRWAFERDATTGANQIAARFGISEVLAQRRLMDAVLVSVVPALAPDVTEPSPSATGDSVTSLLSRLDPSQREAARASGPVLVVAGPGTGKTATLVGRVAYLTAEQRYQPEQVLALTFSNRAAGEMRERLSLSGLPGERMPVMTLHAFAAALLREYCARVPCTPGEAPLKDDFRILDETDAFLLMEELLSELPLHYYRSLGWPTVHLKTLLADFSRARDVLLTPEQYLRLVDEMPLAPEPEDGGETSSAGGRRQRDRPPAGTFTAEQIARARERALAYVVWDRALRARGLLDFGGLIQRAVELLEHDADTLREVRGRFPQILVDEFQDTNRAAARLLTLIAGERGSGLWVVGDRNQSIYRWRGASPHNLPRLVETYPHLRIATLDRCYRSVPAIVQAGSVMAARMAEKAPVSGDAPETLRDAMRAVALQPVRERIASAAIIREEFETGQHEAAGLAHAIRQRREDGVPYSDQAILCRTHKQVAEIGAALDAAGIPVSQLGGFFGRDEIKDAYTLLWLSAGPDGRGLLRVERLLWRMGEPLPAGDMLTKQVRRLIGRRRQMPFALQNDAALAQAGIEDPLATRALKTLGGIALHIHNAKSMADGLARYFLRPGGYAWQLARVADGITAGSGEPEMTPAVARTALAALGEFVRLALRFDVRWTREEDFRDRLTRSVAPARAATPVAPIQPDTLNPDPAADVAPEPAGPPTPAAAVQPAVPTVRCFLRYLDALREAGYMAPIPAGDDDAVSVLTLHASKGLEFPVVYLPRLADGQFPSKGGRRGDPCPPGFRESDDPGEEEAEERCLFYVGVTRARDAVVVTRAKRYSENGGEAQPSRLLTLLDDAPEFASAGTLLDGDTRERIEREIAGDAPATETDDEEIVVRQHTPEQLPVYTLHELEQYINCPLQYKYDRRYGLMDPAENVVHRYYRFLYGGRRTLRNVHTLNPGARWSEAETQLRSLWAEQGPTNHPYTDFYWQHAMSVMRGEWDTLNRPAGNGIPEVNFSETLRARLKSCQVEVTVDHIGRPTADGEPVILMRLHDGRQRPDDQKDLALMLYYLAHRQRYPEREVRIRIGYLPSSLRREQDGEVVSREPEIVDVTDKVRKDVELYQRSLPRARSRLDKLDEAAAGIAAGRFAPHVEEERCSKCAFNWLCPSDPDGAAPEPSAQAVV